MDNDDHIMNDDDSVDDYSDFSKVVHLSEEVMTLLRQNDPSLTALSMNTYAYNTGTVAFNACTIDWEQDGKYISDNTHLKALYLDSYSRRPNADRSNIKAIYRAISNNRTIKYLFVDPNSVDHNEVIEILLPFFENNKCLRRFEINNAILNNSGAKLLISALSKCSLRQFELICSGSTMDDALARDIVASLNRHHPNLRELTLCLENDDISWCVELGLMLKSPTSKLEVLNISGSKIGNKGAVIIGAALSRNKKIKKLSLNELDEYSSVSSLGLVTLVSSVGGCSSLEEIEVSDSNYIGDEVAVVLANTVVAKTPLELLDLSSTNVSDIGILSLSYALDGNTTIKSLDLSCNRSITSSGWRTFFDQMTNNTSALEVLSLVNNNIDDEVVASIVDSFKSSMKNLNVRMNRLITSIGLRTLFTLVQQQPTCLESLCVPRIDDGMMLVFANALVNNNTLRRFIIHDVSVTKQGWGSLADVLCNKSTIESICTSNHTLESIKESGQWQVPNDLHAYLELNKNENKSEVVRQKIIKYHFNYGESNIQKFVNMELNELPQVISWTGRNDIGLSLLYKLCRGMPALFDSDSKAKAGARQKAT